MFCYPFPNKQEGHSSWQLSPASNPSPVISLPLAAWELPSLVWVRRAKREAPAAAPLASHLVVQPAGREHGEDSCSELAEGPELAGLVWGSSALHAGPRGAGGAAEANPHGGWRASPCQSRKGLAADQAAPSCSSGKSPGRERGRVAPGRTHGLRPPPQLTVNRVRASGKLKSAGVGDIFLLARAHHRPAARSDDVRPGATRRPGAARAAGTQARAHEIQHTNVLPANGAEAVPDQDPEWNYKAPEGILQGQPVRCSERQDQTTPD